MHFTGTVYRNPYWPTFPLLEITQGCTHNKCKFCTMYRDVPFRMSPIEHIEEDLHEIAAIKPDATTIQLLSANPLALSFDKLEPILVMINRYLPKMEYIYAATRVTDIRNKTVEELKKMRELGVKEISLGVESGDDETYLEIWKQFIKRWNELLPEVPLYSNIYISVFPDWLENYEQSSYWNFEQAILYANIAE